MREPITKLAIIPFSAIDISLTKSLPAIFGSSIIRGGGNESPIIFFIARATKKTRHHFNEKRIVLLTLKYFFLYDDKGVQSRCIFIPDITKAIVCQDGFVVFKIPTEHDLVIRLDDGNALLDYFLNILKVIKAHFGGGQGNSGTVTATNYAKIEVTASAQSFDQLGGSDKINLNRNPQVHYRTNIPVPTILNVDAKRQDLLESLLYVAPPPKRLPTSEFVVPAGSSDEANALRVLSHPLFHPPGSTPAPGQSIPPPSAPPVTARSDASPKAAKAPPPSLWSNAQPPPAAQAQVQVVVSPPPARSPTPPPINSPIVLTPLVPGTPASTVVLKNVARDLVESPPRPSAVIASATSVSIDQSPIPPAVSRFEDDSMERPVRPSTQNPPPPPPPLIAKTILPSEATPTTVPNVRAEHYRRQVEAFFTLYNPSKLDQVDDFVAEFGKGREMEGLLLLHKACQVSVPPHIQQAADQEMRQKQIKAYSRATTQNDEYVDPSGMDALQIRLKALEDENRSLKQQVSSSSQIVRRGEQSGNSTRQSRLSLLQEDIEPEPLETTASRPAARSALVDRSRDASRTSWSNREQSSSGVVHGDDLEAFEDSIHDCSAQERLVLRQHRIDQKRRFVKNLIHSAQGSMETKVSLTIGAIQDELLVLIEKQQTDQQILEASQSKSNESSSGLEASVKAPGRLAPSTQPLPPTDSQAAYTQWYYTQYLPHAMLMAQQHQLSRGSSTAGSNVSGHPAR